MGLFRRRKNRERSLAGASGSDAVVRHRDTGLVVMNVDHTVNVSGQGTVVSGLLRTEVQVGQRVVLERGGARSGMQVESLEIGDQQGQLLDRADAGTQIGIFLTPTPTVFGEVSDALT